MRQIGPYKLNRVLGAGGMGQVFLAVENKTGQTVALKVIQSRYAGNPAARVRFVQEARAARQLHHPHIVAIHDFGQARGALYIAMEYLQGVPLTAFIPGPPSLSLRRKLSIVAECADALDYAHSRGVVHRDVKPANMMILADRSLKLVDFGLAGWIRLPHSKVHGGTPPYMSPEQIGPREVDGRTDIWSAGVTLFELLTGRLPFRSLEEIASAPPPALPRDFPFAVDFNAVLARALAKDPQMRYAAAAQFAADLRALREKCEQSGIEAAAGAASGYSPLPAAAPSSGETEPLPPVLLVAGEAAISPPPVESPPASPPRQPAPVSPPGTYVFSELGFECPAAGDLETTVGRFAFNDRAHAVRAWRDRSLILWLLIVAVMGTFVWLYVLASLPHISPDARQELRGLGVVAVLLASLLLLALAWLAATACARACPPLGIPEHFPLCRRCLLRMRQTAIWTRICSSREEVFFGYRDCMAALKQRLWQEAAMLLSIYGEENLSKYRERFISASIRYHIRFFECRSCAHHAARLTTDETIEKRWQENARFEEAYWGSAPPGAPTPPPKNFDLRVAGEAIKELLPFRPERPVLTLGAVVAAFAVISWIAFAGWSAPPVSPRIARVAWSPDARWVAAATASGSISVWDMSTGAARHIAFPPGPLQDLQFSPDSSSLAIASRDLGLYSPALSSAPRLLRADRANYHSLRFSADGRTLLVVTGFGKIETVDPHSGALALEMCCSTIGGDVGEAVFTPDGQVIANAGQWPGLWDARSGEFLARLPTDLPNRSFRCIAFDAPHSLVLMGSSTGAVWAWDWKTRQLRGGARATAPIVGNIDTLAVSLTGMVMFAGTTVSMWNLYKGGVRSWSGSHPSSNLVLSPDAATLLFGTAKGNIEFWNVALARRVRALQMR